MPVTCLIKEVFEKEEFWKDLLKLPICLTIFNSEHKVLCMEGFWADHELFWQRMEKSCGIQVLLGLLEWTSGPSKLQVSAPGLADALPWGHQLYSWAITIPRSSMALWKQRSYFLELVFPLLSSSSITAWIT